MLLGQFIGFDYVMELHWLIDFHVKLHMIVWQRSDGMLQSGLFDVYGKQLQTLLYSRITIGNSK